MMPRDGTPFVYPFFIRPAFVLAMMLWLRLHVPLFSDFFPLIPWFSNLHWTLAVPLTSTSSHMNTPFYL